MTSQYRCETCNTIPCPYHVLLKEIYMDDLLQISVCLTERERVTKCVGCASHSDFKQEREKVLKKVISLINKNRQSFVVSLQVQRFVMIVLQEIERLRGEG